LKEPVVDDDIFNDASPASGAIDELIERWWADHFPGSPVAQVTQAWNHAFAAKEELKRRLKNFTSEAVRTKRAGGAQ
jgi:hypothetical protein